jgi:hypothetical protein
MSCHAAKFEENNLTVNSHTNMELVKQTQSWIKDIQHCVQFDSWKQFEQMGIGLTSNWCHLSLLTWGCRVERSAYVLQVIYIHLNPQKEEKKEILPAFRNHRFELKCVEIGIKDADVPAVREWLVAHNPDLWKMNFLKPVKLKDI